MKQALKEHQILSSKEFISLEKKYGAHNYAPLEVVLSKGEGINVWDIEGNHYYDFLSAYSALNQGHCHPQIVNAVIEQAGKLTLTSRAFYNDQLGKCEAFMSDLFAYDKVLLMNSGVEAVESAIKLARKWGYNNKKIKSGNAIIVAASNNFHGRTTGVISFSSEMSARKGFEPFLPGFELVPYNDLNELEKALKNPDVCAFLVEPIQGEAGVIVPDTGYLKKVKSLCNKYNVLFIADEIQTGLGRSGKILCVDHEEVRPDIVTLGKALSGGMFPVSAVLCDDEIMLNIKPGEHGSTFGGNPMAAAVAIVSLQVLLDENLSENSEIMGKYFRERMKQIDVSFISDVRGKGLLNAVQIDESKAGCNAYDICKKLKNNGLLSKQTHNNTIRFTPPLIINKEQMKICSDIIEHTFVNLL